MSARRAYHFPIVHVLLGYFLCLVVLTPALSIDVFFALIGATTRQHDLLAIVRSISRMLLTVTSPFKIALTVLALLGVFLSDSNRRVRGIGLLLAATFGGAELWPGIGSPALAEIGNAFVLAIWVAATVLSFAAGSRLIAARTR